MKISFVDAASELEELCQKIDNAEEIGPLLQQLFEQRHESFIDSVDRKIRYRAYLESQMQKANHLASVWDSRSHSLAMILSDLNNIIVNTIKANPNLKFQGRLGGFRLQKSPKKLILDEEKLASQFFSEQKITKPNKELIMEYLNCGSEVEGARFEQGEHLRTTKEIANEE
jgi:hypothetical protein